MRVQTSDQTSPQFYYTELPGVATQSVNHPQSPSIESKIDQNVRDTILREPHIERKPLPQERLTWIQNCFRDDDPNEGSTPCDRREEKIMFLGTVFCTVLIVAGFLYIIVRP